MPRPTRSKQSAVPPPVPAPEPEPSGIPGIPEMLVIGTGLVLLLTLLYALQAFGSPFIIAGAILFLLYPLRGFPVAKNIMVLATALFLLWLFATIDEILSPFVLSLVLAYLLHPVVTRLENTWRIPRWSSAVFIILISIAVLIVLIVLGLPHIIGQFEGILQAIGTISTQFVEWVLDGRFIKALQKYGISADQLRTMLTNSIAPRVEDILKGILKGTFGIVSGLQVIVSGIVNIIIIPFLTFFLLKDFPLVRHRIKMLVPRKRRAQSVQFYHRVDEILGRYIRGTTIIAIIDGVTVTIGLWIIGIQYPLVLGILSGFLFFVPYFGFITILCVSAFVASLSMGSISLPVISTVSFLGVLHIIENYVLTPRIIGNKIGLHPVLLIFSLFIFGYFLGFIGLLIAIPAAAIIIVSVKEWEMNRKKELTTDAAEEKEEA
ncbi:MAG: AI-2E family transporter [Bacteroidetes bacterium]|nr:AI-2E family transporter [Bacteroidota bacterium]